MGLLDRRKYRVYGTLGRGQIKKHKKKAWNGLPGKVVAAEKVDKFKLELDRNLEVMEIEGYGDVDKTLREFEH